DLHSVPGDLDAEACEDAALLGALVEDRIRVVDVDEDLAGLLRQLAEVLEHPARAALRQMADIPRALARDADTDHLVVGPERAVDEHAVGGAHSRRDGRIDLAEPGRVERGPARRR